MQVFHRKVHPENMSGMMENKVTKEVKQEIKGKPPIGKNFFKSEIYRKIGFSCFKCGSSTSPPMLEESDSCPRISREHWIKTDAECECFLYNYLGYRSYFNEDLIIYLFILCRPSVGAVERRRSKGDVYMCVSGMKIKTNDELRCV